MPKERKLDIAELSGPAKAAILLLSLGEDLSAEVFKRLSEPEVRRISQEITQLGGVSDDVSRQVLEQCQLKLASRGQVQGNAQSARKILENAFSPEVARGYVREIDLESGLTEKSLEQLRKADPKQLARLLQHEHPQTVALLLSHLSSRQAALIVSFLDLGMSAEVCLRLAQIDHISRPIRDRVIGMVADKLEGNGSFDSARQGGVRQVAEIFNHLDRETCHSCLEAIEHENPNMALAIRNSMFVFEDLQVLADTDMRKIIQSIDKRTLVIALKGTSDDLKKHFFRNMSSRAVQMLQEDMEEMGPIRIKDADRAQQEIIHIVRELEHAGNLDLGATEAGEYVS